MNSATPFTDRRRSGEWIDDTLEDPIAGAANLFDVSMVFVVALIVALFSAFNLLDLFDPSSTVTMTRETADGEIEIVRKEGTEIQIQRVSDRSLSGEGTRLGTAYQLDDGRIIYVPED
jgi:hypothetical protein